MDVTLLGPQRRPAAARAAVRELMPDGPIATVNAGWAEREDQIAELDDVLGGRMVVLGLFARWRTVLAEDPELVAAQRRLADELTERQELYALRLAPALAAAQTVGRRSKLPAARDAAVADAIRAVQALDEWHRNGVADARASFYAETAIGERPGVAAHRRELAELTADCAGWVLPGGHVGILLHLLHVFGVAGMIRAPLIAWSAGAMALSDRVVLFSAYGPPGHRQPEVYAEGLGVYAGVLPFPHARRRLDLGDSEQMGLLARRFAPRTCLLLPDGARIDLVPDQPLPAGARWIDPSGRILTAEPAEPAERAEAAG